MESPEMGMKLPKITKFENVDKYEKEKIENTLKDAKHLVAVIENYLEMVKYCDEQGIDIKGRTSLEKLRYPNGPAGPDSDLGKLSQVFESGQSEISKNLTREQVNQIRRERIDPEEQR